MARDMRGPRLQTSVGLDGRLPGMVRVGLVAGGACWPAPFMLATRVTPETDRQEWAWTVGCWGWRLCVWFQCCRAAATHHGAQREDREE